MSMDCEIIEEPLARLSEHARIPIRFEVRSLLKILGDDPGTAVLEEHPVGHPWVKDYDAIEEERPTSWPDRWDTGRWGLLAAYVDGQRVGGCVLAHNTDGMDMLEGRDDVVAVWDLRVHPAYRGQRIGSRLFAAAVRWARDRQCRELKVETQNINVPACRSYARQGCQLDSINRGAYEAFPEEVELVWCLVL